MELRVTQRGPSLDALTERKRQQLLNTTRRVGREIETRARRVILDEARRGRGSLRFDRSTLGVDARSRSSGDRADVELRGSPAGAWAIAESGAKRHAIRPRRGRAMPIGGGRFAAAVNHPGTRGRRAWSRSRTTLTRALRDTVTDAYDEAMR